MVVVVEMSCSSSGASCLYLAASSRTAGRDERKVEIFWREKTSWVFQCLETAKKVLMRLSWTY